MPSQRTPEFYRERHARRQAARAAQQAQDAPQAPDEPVVVHVDGQAIWCASQAVADAFRAELSAQKRARVAADPGVAALLASGAVAWGAERFPRPDGKTDREMGLPRSTGFDGFGERISRAHVADRDYLLNRINRANAGRPPEEPYRTPSARRQQAKAAPGRVQTYQEWLESPAGRASRIGREPAAR